MTMLLDAGAFLAVERGERRVAALLQQHVADGGELRTHGGVVAQVWRGGARQARLARLLRTIDVVAIGAAIGQQTGSLLALAGTTDVIDAALVCIAGDGDTVVTSDPGDLGDLLDAAAVQVALVVV